MLKIMKKLAYSVAIAIGVLMAISVPTPCQERTWAGASLMETVNGTHWRIENLRINAAFSLLNAGYDSDIFYGFLDSPKPDLTAAASLPIQVFLPFGKNVVLDIFENPEYAFYLKTRSERAWNNAFRGQLHLALERIYAKAGIGAASVRQRLDPELNVNFREQRRYVDGTFLWQTSRKTSVAAVGEIAEYDYGNEVFGAINIGEALNRTERHIDVVTYVQPNPRARFFIDGQFGSYSFSSPSASSRDTRSYAVYGGIFFTPREDEGRATPPPQGRISFGYKRFDIINPALKDGAGLVGAVDLTVGLFRRTVGRALFSRDFSFSVYPGSTFFDSTTYGAGLMRLLSRHSSLAYDLTFNGSRYPAASDGGSAPGRDFRYVTHELTLRVQFTRLVGLSLFGILAKRRIEGEPDWLARNFFGLSFIYGVPPQSILTPERALIR